MAAAFLRNLPAAIEVQGLQSKPELNGRRGRAVEFDAASGRYHCVLNSGEAIALKPTNLCEAGAAQQNNAPPPPAVGGGAGFQLPAMPDGVEPKHVAMISGAVLVLGLGFSLLNAGLLCGLGLLTHSAARQQGGIGPAARALSRKVAGTISRLTGMDMTPTQAAVLLVAGVVVVYWQLVGFESLGFGGAGSGGGNRRYGGSSGSSSSYSSSRDSYRQRSGRHGSSGGGYRDDEGYGGGWGGGGWGGGGGGNGGFLGLGSGFDLSFMLGAAMLGSTVYRLGGGGRPEGWSVGQFIHGVRNLDIFQMMMLMNLVQQVLGGGRRRGGYGGYGGFGRRGMYY